MDAVQDLNPDEQIRPIHSGVELKNQYSSLKTKLSTIYSRYSVSGSHESDTLSLEGMESWIFSYAQGDSSAQYAVLVLDVSIIKTLGRQMPPGYLIDSGLIGLDNSTETIDVNPNHTPSKTTQKGQKINLKNDFSNNESFTNSINSSIANPNQQD